MTLSRTSTMCPATYLVFGDLHGLVLPAFKLAQAWSREHDVVGTGLLQVGDLGDSRLERNTKRHTDKGSLTGGVPLPGEDADDVFSAPSCPETMWFTAGNHEDYDWLQHQEIGRA